MMCDDMDFDVSSDVSDSSFDIADDVSSDFDDTRVDFDDVGTEDFSFDDISDDSSDIDDSFSYIDDSIDFADSFEIDDISEDLDIDSSEEKETLDFDDDFDSADEFEPLEIDDVSFDDGIETLELDDDIESLELNDSLDEVETLELEDSSFDIAEEFETTDEIEELSLGDNIDYDLDDVSDNVETLDFDDDFFAESFDEISNETAELEINGANIENSEDDFSNEIPSDEIQNENMDTSIDLNDETLDNDNYEVSPISEIPIVDEYGDVDVLESIMNDNSDSVEIQTEADSYEIIPNEYSDSENEIPEVGPYEATPISELPIVQENNELLDEIEETSDDATEENFEEFSDENLEQALLDDVVNNVPLTDTVYEDDSEFNNIDSEIPEMTDEELAEFIDWENQHENGNYDLIDDIMNDESLTDDQKEFMTQQLLDEIQEGENEVPEYGQRVKGLTYDGRDIINKPDEFEDNFEQTEQIGDIFNGELTESDIDAVYEGLESYDFQGVDCFEDVERLDSSLESFTSENWEQLSLDEQKEKMADLADYIIDVTGLENPPCIEFYSNPQEGDYGGFDRTTNTLSINEHMLYQNDEAADTIAHELWHALQYQRASNPRTKLDAMYAENFNDYISPQEDFEGYQSQILEAEARAFAQQIKDRLHSY